jgi:cobalt-zinc-cadmium efflux system protein
VTSDTSVRYLAIALALTVGFMVLEVVVALLSSSLALLADAGHMLTDAGAIGASIWAVRLAARPPEGEWTFGFKRAEILSAAGNGITLLVVAALVSYESVRRLIQPPAVEGVALLVVAIVGVAVNLVATWVLARANRTSLNVEGAFQQHSHGPVRLIGTVVAGIVIVTTGFRRADPIASLVVVALMLRAAWGLLKQSGRVLLEAAPHSVDLQGGTKSPSRDCARQRRPRPARLDRDQRSAGVVCPCGR